MAVNKHEADLRDLLTQLSGLDAAGVELDADLTQVLGLDSLAGLRLLAGVEKKFHVRFPDQRLGEFRTLKQLLEFLDETEGTR